MNSPVGQYVRVVRRRWRWPVWGVLLALALTTIALIAWPPEYQVRAKVFVRTPGDVSRVMDGGSSYAQARAVTYSALAKSDDLAARVVADLGLDLDSQSLARRVRAAPEAGTALMDVAVSAPSAAEAQRTATVLLSELGETVRTLESVPGSLIPRAELVVVDQPRSPARVVFHGVPVPVALLGAAVVGLVLGLTGGVLRSTSGGSADDGTDEPIAPIDVPPPAGPDPDPVPDPVGADAVADAVANRGGSARHRRGRHSAVRATED